MLAQQSVEYVEEGRKGCLLAVRTWQEFDRQLWALQIVSLRRTAKPVAVLAFDFLIKEGGCMETKLTVDGIDLLDNIGRLARRRVLDGLIVTMEAESHSNEDVNNRL